MTVTTIKVPVQLRERISVNAADRGITASALLTELVDAYERSLRFTQIKRAYSALAAEDGYWDETREWDSTLADGLPDE